ncbi:hypothetical protein OAS39_10285, partial [Pirellulales bacterium]|nr:hypothetical protein [Pirellulales bacterium]
SNTLFIELGGTTPGTQYDLLTIAGDVTINGLLDVTALGGFVPAIGNDFELIDVAGTRAGEFAGLSEGALVGNFGGTGLFITYSGGDGNDVSLFADVPGNGDFDIDGDVDGFDFLAWQRGFGTLYESNDLATWELNYGAVPLLANNTTAVPEPSPLLLVVMVGLVRISLRRP